MFRTFIQVAALTLTFFAAIFLIKGMMLLKAEEIAGLSSTYWDFNSYTVKNITGSRADTIVGALLLFLGFLLQLGNALWPMRIGDFEVNRKGVLLGILVSCLIAIGGYYMSQSMQRSSEQEVISRLQSQQK